MPLASKPVAQSLLPNPYPRDHINWKAYQECLLLEQNKTWNIFAGDLHKDASDFIMTDLGPETCARVLGWALRYAPSQEGRAALAREIIACEANPELLAGLAHLYVYGLIRVFYNPKGPTPSPSASQSPRLSFRQAVNNVSDILQKPSISAKDLRQLTLLRDKNSCVFTGWCDIHSWRSLGRPQCTGIHITRVAHIISQSLSEGIIGTTEAARKKFEWAKTAGAMIERFGGFSAHDILGNDHLNSPTNAFTATDTPHEMFDSLDLWLLPSRDAEGNNIANTYDIHTLDGSDLFKLMPSMKQQITFEAIEYAGRTIPAPDSRIVALHAACAQIAHMSGAAEPLKELYRDTDMISCMTEPNAAYELARALKTLDTVCQLPGLAISTATVHP